MGRLIIGFAPGCYLFLVQIYIGEIASKENRAKLLNYIHIFIYLGILFSFTIGNVCSLTTMNICLTIIPMFYGIVFQFLPESPPFLISKKRFEKAHENLNFFNETKVVFVHETMELMNKTGAKVEAKKSLCELLKVKSIRKATIIMNLQFLFFQMSGGTTINFYLQTIFAEAGIGINPGYASIVNILIALVPAFLSVIYARKFGRKILIYTCNTVISISLFLIGTYFILKNTQCPMDSFKWIPLVAMFSFSVAFIYGMASFTYGLLGELFTIDAKKTIAPICQIINHALTFTISISFPFFSGLIGVGYIFYIFALMTLVNVIFVMLYVPETNGKSIDEIQRDLAR
jgi:Sugar (and other) transporter